MLRLLVLTLLLLPGAALGQDAETEPAAETVEEAPKLDLLTTRLQAMVQDYYVAIGSEASDDDLKQGVQSVQMMLLDGVSMSRIEAAIAAAVSLHTPGRRIPFQVAVPLRVRPADSAPRPAPAIPVESGDPETTATEPALAVPAAPAGEPEKSEERTAIEKRWVERQEQLRKRRNRLRLHLQWRDRTKEKRILLSLGIPLFVAGWAGTFSVAGATMTFGETLPSTGWTGAIPIAGPFVFAGLTDAQYPAVFAFAAFQGIGLALTIVALTKKIDWPYDRDPTALYLGRDRRTGKPKVTIHGGPMGLVGEF